MSNVIDSLFSMLSRRSSFIRSLFLVACMWCNAQHWMGTLLGALTIVWHYLTESFIIQTETVMLSLPWNKCISNVMCIRSFAYGFWLPRHSLHHINRRTLCTFKWIFFFSNFFHFPFFSLLNNSVRPHATDVTIRMSASIVTHFGFLN